MKKPFPGPKTVQALERGIPLFKNGLRFHEAMQQSGSRGFRTVRQIVVDRAEGDYVWDLDGRRYIDFQNGWATNPLGNCHPEILDAVEQANRRYGFHYDHPLRYELAERLAGTMPNKALPRTNYEVSGTEAAEAAVQLALTYTKRQYVITFGASYHGNSIAGKILSGLSGHSSSFLAAWSGGVIRAPYPFSDGIPAGLTHDQYTEFCLWYLEHQINESLVSRDDIAAVMLEPGLAEGGNWIPSQKFVRGVREVCDRNNWLMINDEVLTGLGRTGKMWAIEHYESRQIFWFMARISLEALHRYQASLHEMRYWGTTRYSILDRLLRVRPPAARRPSKPLKFTSGTTSFLTLSGLARLRKTLWDLGSNTIS